MRPVPLLALALLTVPLAGCVGGSAEFAQKGITEVATVTLSMEQEKKQWTPRTAEGHAMTVETLLALHPAEPAADQDPVAWEALAETFAQEDWVLLTLKENRSHLFVNTTLGGHPVDSVYAVLSQPGTQEGSERMLLCSSSTCELWETPRSLDALREAATKAMAGQAGSQTA